jgi:hypothetical protein
MHNNNQHSVSLAEKSLISNIKKGMGIYNTNETSLVGLGGEHEV